MVTAQALLDHPWPLALGVNADGEPFEGYCPCCTIKGDGFTVEVHCWRQCEGFSEIAVYGSVDDATARRIAEHIRDHNGWTDRTDWHIELL